MQSVYFDNAATTNIRKEVVNHMTEIMLNNFGNSSSSHSYGRSSKAIVEKSRKNIAAYFNASPGEIVFIGIKHFITSKIEHHAVVHTLEQLQEEYTVDVSFVKLKKDGFIDLKHLEELLIANPKSLISLMHVNNEIGNLLDMDKVAQLCKMHGALFHSDSVQSVGHFNFDVSKTPIDYFAASAHKFHGPKGVGFAFIRKDSGLKPLIFGGDQERGFRAGTESVHNIVGLDTALTLAYKNLEEEMAYIKGLKVYFIEELKKAIPDVKFNGASGDLERSTYTLVNVRFPISLDKGTMFLFQLDLKGIACSKGSACQSGSNIGSHVLTEILTEEEMQNPSIRFSFSSYNTREEVDYVVSTLKELINL
jgi:cysteine desulfurase